MMDYILIAILLLLAAAIVFYLIREKKRGAACIGCPYSKTCGKKKSNGCSCCGSTKEA